MKTTVSIILWCALSISGQEDRQILFPENEYAPKRSVIVARQINQGTSNYDKQVESAFTEGITALTLNLHNHAPLVIPELANSDVAYGPLTIAGALALILLASVGETANEIANVMGLLKLDTFLNNPLAVHAPISRLLDRIDTNEISSPNEVVSYATAIFVQHSFPIRQEFLKACDGTYQSEVISLNFRKKALKAQEEINNWVSRKTNGKILNLFNGPPPPETTAIIASVLYFKAAWEFPFFDGYTKPKPFYVNGRNQPSDRNVDMMVNGGEFPYFKDRNSNVEIMGFPYKGKRITMYVLLPNDSSISNLRNLEHILTPSYIHELVNSTRTTEAVITFPKLKIESSINLKSILETFNIHSLFNSRQSNLALMSPGIKNVIQNHPQSSSPGGQNFGNTNPSGVSSDNRFAGVPTTYPQASNQNVNQQNYAALGAQNNNQQNFGSFETQSNYGPNPEAQNFYPNYLFTGTQNNRPTAGQQNVYQQNNPTSGVPTNYQANPFLRPQNNIAQNNFVQDQSQRDVYNLPQRPLGVETNNNPTTARTPYTVQQTTKSDLPNRLIFIRSGASGCPIDQNNIARCDLANETEHMVLSPKFSSQSNTINDLNNLDKIRKSPNLPNPGIYADEIIHRVYIEITETGTEAAAVTGVSLNRSGGRVAFRLDVPFLFFIYHEESKVILFWGSVKNPTPSRSP